MNYSKHLVFSLFISLSLGAFAQINPNKFQPMSWEWPTPDECRTASGAPGPKYWQQQVDYKINVTLNDGEQKIQGKETITYKNNSPHTLTFLWLQLDQETFRNGSTHFMMESGISKLDETWQDLERKGRTNDLGCNIVSVKDASGKILTYSIIETNMRVMLPTPLASNASFTFEVEWNHRINNAKIEGRCGYEYFEKDQNYLYEIAQWYPRLCLYDNAKGWETQPFFGNAEFALEFGNFEVHITAPADHVVAATGVLQNPKEVLTATQLERYMLAMNTFEDPAFIITPEEAKANESSRADNTKTWSFRAENVRDFSFASSRKFAWDASAVKVGSKTVLAQSFYPNEAVPLWDKYSTHAIMHTLKSYSNYTLDYPYPTAIAVNGPVWGMEYPMICFCGGRPDASGNYSDWTKNTMVSVVIHEVGHNFFPMLINNDERRWAWMDEGFNSFFEYLAEQEWFNDYPSHRGPAKDMASFMAGPSVNPIMTNAESIWANGNTSYGKTSAGLWLLREVILGRDEFKVAFNEYARRWAFHHPEPADFFRTVRDVTGKNLDWFWREWFYSVDQVDLEISSVDMESTSNPSYFTPKYNYANETHETYYAVAHGLETAEANTNSPRTFKWNNDNGTPPQGKGYQYKVTIERKGEFPMPIPVSVVFTDNSVAHYMFPVESWIKNNVTFTATIITDKPARGLVLDYFEMLPDDNLEGHVVQVRYGSIQSDNNNGDNPEPGGKKKKKNQ